MEHRRSKDRFARSSGKEIPTQLSRMDQRERNIKAISERLAQNKGVVAATAELPHDLTAGYNIAANERTPVNIRAFVREHRGDPAIKVTRHHIHAFRTADPASPRTSYRSCSTISCHEYCTSWQAKPPWGRPLKKSWTGTTHDMSC